LRERRAGAAHGDVGVAAQRALLHVAVADADPAHERVQRLGVGDRFLRRAHVRLRDDLEERGARAVQVDAAHAAEILVQRLARVLLEVRAGEAHALLALAQHDRDRAAGDDRLLVLADLVALRKVRVEIVLAREDAARGDRAAHREPEADRTFDRAAVEDRQRPGEREIHGARLRVGRGAERGGGAREDLRRGRELRVGLEADDDFPGHRRCVGVHLRSLP